MNQPSPAQILAFLCICGLIGTSSVASAAPEVNYNLGLGGELWGNPFSSRFRFDDEFHLSGMNMNMSGFGLRAEVGDISANWEQLGLAGQNFQGMKLDVPLGKANLDLLGGTVILQPDSLERRDPLDETPRPAIVSPIYGLRASLPLSRSFSLSGAQLFTPNAVGPQGKSISTLALDYQAGKHERLALEIARSQNGAGWQLSGATQQGRLRAQGNYRQTDLGFSSAGNPNLVTRRNGGSLNAQYQVARTLTLNASSERYTDGNGGHTNYDGVNISFARPKKPSLDFFWHSAEIKSLSTYGESDERSTAYNTVGFRLSHSLGSNRLIFQHDHYNFNSDGTSSSRSSSDRFSLGWSRPLGRQTQMSFSQTLDLNRASQDSTGRSLYTSLDLRQQIGKSGLRVDLGLQYVNRTTNDQLGQAVSAHAGFNYRLPSGSSVGMQYRTRLTGSGSLSKSPIDRLYVSYSHHFGGATRSNSRFSAQERRQLGKVLGRVFEDRNGNGKWETGEPGISDITLRSRGNAPQQTDRNGVIRIDQMRPGDYRFQMVSKTLPIEYTTMTPTEVMVTVPAGKSALVEFPVMRTGQAKGTVYWDENRNGKRDEGEDAAKDFVVHVQGADVIGFTDAKGNFTLDGLPPRNWKVAVSVELLGEDYENTGYGFAEASVPANGVVTGLLLGIAPKARTVVTGFQKSQ